MAFALHIIERGFSQLSPNSHEIGVWLRVETTVPNAVIEPAHEYCSDGQNGLLL